MKNDIRHRTKDIGHRTKDIGLGIKNICFWLLIFHFSFFTFHFLSAANYAGRVLDNHGNPISYATVYLVEDPTQGTATNSDGYFTLQTTLPASSTVIISFLGYEKASESLEKFAIRESSTQNEIVQQSAIITLIEQPIALEEMVVSAHPSKQKNKRKQMAQLLYQVYNQLEYDWPNENVKYTLVSDVQMLSEGQPWGMEQMIAEAVSLPEKGKDGRDSIQFHGLRCKRYFKPEIRLRADSIYAGEMDARLRKAALAVDSGVYAHEILCKSRQAKYQLLDQMQDLRHWTVSRENEGQTVLTYTEKHNYIGIFKYEIHSHYIVDSETLRLQRFSEDANIELNIPFGHKLKAQELALLNLLNMSDDEIERFRLRHMNAHIQMNTLYKRHEDILLSQERNLRMDASLTGSKKANIPIVVTCTQQVTATQQHNVHPLPKSALKKRVIREIVEIY